MRELGAAGMADEQDARFDWQPDVLGQVLEVVIEPARWPVRNATSGAGARARVADKVTTRESTGDARHHDADQRSGASPRGTVDRPVSGPEPAREARWTGRSAVRSQPVAHGVERGLGAILKPELAQDIRHVSFDRPFADDQRPRDFFVAATLRQQAQDFSLALGQLRARFGLARRGDLLHQSPRNFRM